MTDSDKSLWLKLAAAAVVAAALLVAFVLPAEYGRDPTGIGKLTGLSDLHKAGKKIKDYGQNLGFNVEPYDLYADSINHSIQGLINLQEQTFKSETIMLQIEQFGELEHKFIMQKDAVLMYSWEVLNAQGSGVYYDFHGHPASKDADDYPEKFEQSFSKGEGHGQSGSLIAPLSGYHGWYFVNREDDLIEVKLTVSGYYQKHLEMYRAVDGVLINKAEF